MNKVFLFLIMFIYCSCNGNSVDFNSFDITYDDGWAEHFSFKTDSLGNYYVESAKLEGYTCKGKLPDSMMVKFVDLSKKIRNKKIKDSIGEKCIDCEKLSISIDNNDRVFLLNQMYYVDNEIYDLINPLSKFVFEARHQKTDSFVVFKSKTIAPKPWVDPVEFVKPK